MYLVFLAMVFHVKFSLSCLIHIYFYFLASGIKATHEIKKIVSKSICKFIVIVGVSKPRGVPGPTSELSPCGPAQMGRREAEREGGKGNSRREAGVRERIHCGSIAGDSVRNVVLVSAPTPFLNAYIQFEWH
jgi:hypothetical protein